MENNQQLVEIIALDQALERSLVPAFLPSVEEEEQLYCTHTGEI